jgi:hypothetical protein
LLKQSERGGCDERRREDGGRDHDDRRPLFANLDLVLDEFILGAG